MAAPALFNPPSVIPGGAKRREGDPDFAVLQEKQGRLGSLPVPLRGPPGMTMSARRACLARLGPLL
jgi:hypothetical protein